MVLDAARSAIGRLMRRPAPKSGGVRRFEGAAGGYRTTGWGTSGPINPDVWAAASIVRGRARSLRRNNPWMANAATNWTNAVDGSGLRPISPDAEAVAVFDEWAIGADATETTDFYGLQSIVVEAVWVDGEAFVLMRFDEEDRLQLEVVPAEAVDESMTATLANGHTVTAGIERDSVGRRVAYWMIPQDPTLQFATYAPAVRVDAADVLHVRVTLSPGQVRGISAMAPAITRAAGLEQLEDALQQGVLVSTLNSVFLVETNGAASSPYDEADVFGSAAEMGMTPGAMIRLGGGVDVKTNTPQQAQQTAEFVKHNVRALAAAVGLPAHYLDGDLTGANFSSLKAGDLPFQARVEAFQNHVLIPQLLRPVWRRVMLLAGKPEAKAEWLAPRWRPIDPQKALAADVAEIEAGLASRRQKVAERGWAVEELDTEIAADRQRERELGLSFPPPPPVPAAPQTEPEDA